MSEEKIMGLYVYRFITSSRFACSLMPSGAVGMMEGLSINQVKASPESPATVLFVKALDAKEIEWCSERKCFVCKAENPQFIVI